MSACPAKIRRPGSTIQELRSLRRSVEGFALFVNCSCIMREAASMVATNAVTIKDSRTCVGCLAVRPTHPALRVRPRRYTCGYFQRSKDAPACPRSRGPSTDGYGQRGAATSLTPAPAMPASLDTLSGAISHLADMVKARVGQLFRRRISSDSIGNATRFGNGTEENGDPFTDMAGREPGTFDLPDEAKGHTMCVFCFALLKHERDPCPYDAPQVPVHRALS